MMQPPRRLCSWILIIFVGLLAAEAHCQPDSLWLASDSFRPYRYAWDILTTPSGDYLLIGWVGFIEDPGRHGFVMLSSQEQGDSVWMKEYGGDYMSEFYDAITSPSGEILLTGYDGGGACVVKIDTTGEVLWSGDWPDAYWFRGIYSTQDGGFVAGGTDGWDIYAVRADSTGQELWHSTFGLGGNRRIECTSIIRTMDGGYAVTGVSPDARPLPDMYLFKLNSDGDVEWSKSYGGDGADGSGNVIQTPDGGFVLGGYTESFGAGRDDMYLVKIDSTGDEQWSRTYGGTGSEYCANLLRLADGGFILVGVTNSFDIHGAYRYYVVRTDENGEELWHTMYYPRPLPDYLAGVVQTSDGGYAFVGNGGNGYLDLIKTGRDPVNNSVSVTPIHPADFVLYPAFPNPFNSSTTLDYQIPTSAPVSVRIFDLSGRTVATMFNGPVAPGEHQLLLNASGLQAGTYLMQLEAGKYQQAAKVTLVK